MASHKSCLPTDKESVKLTGTMTDSPHHMDSTGLERYIVSK